MWRILWRNWRWKAKVDAELEDELCSYQQMLEDEKVASGLDRATARRQALIELGGIEQIKEEVRDIRRGSMFENVWQELQQSVRGLRRNAAMTTLGVVMLALGMGASTTIFSVFQSALLKPLPFRDVDRVVEVLESRGERGMNRVSFSEANFWDVRSQNHSFESIGAYHGDSVNLTGDGTPEKVRAPGVTADFFRALGVTPLMGRDFTEQDEHAQVALMGHKFWKSRYGGDGNILGKTLRLNEKSYEVIGVLPPGEPWLDDQVYLPYPHHSDAERGSWEFSAVGRLAKGVTPEAARADLQRIASALDQAYPRADKGIGFVIDPSTAWIAPEASRRALWVLLGAVLLLLLIACLNVTNLLLARGLARQREIAVRTALGAGRGRLIRYVMMESLVLSACGAVLGLALSYGSLHILRQLEVSSIPRLEEASLNPWVLGFAVLTALLTGVLCGLAPALQAPSGGISTVLREGDRQAGNRRQGRLRAILVTGEVALSFLLLVGAGLLIRSFREMMTEQRGFQTEHRLMFSVNYPSGYDGGKQFIDRLFAEVSTIPQVIAVGGVNVRPMAGWNPGMNIDSNYRGTDAGAPPWAGWRIVSPGYFQAVGLPLLRGRIFNENDKPVWGERNQPEPVRRVLLSDRLARMMFPNQDPIGKSVFLWKGQGNRPAEVVGVVGDSLERGLTRGPALTVYIAYGGSALTSQFVVHTRGEPMAVASTVRAILAKLDPNLPVADVRSFEEVVSRSVAPQRLNSALLGGFSGLALLLASLGIYGVLSYSISRRTSEIGLRMALGASQGSILKSTLVQGLKPAVVGIFVGAVAAYWLSRSMGSLLFGVKPFDLVTYGAVAVLLLLTAALACYLPGRRAMRTDPAIALRIE